jgi:hypothetical protein
MEECADPTAIILALLQDQGLHEDAIANVQILLAQFQALKELIAEWQPDDDASEDFEEAMNNLIKAIQHGMKDSIEKELDELKDVVEQLKELDVEGQTGPIYPGLRQIIINLEQKISMLEELSSD